MKHLSVAATILAASAGLASAMVRSDDLSPRVSAEVVRVAPGFDAASLTPDQIAALNGIYTNSNDLRTASDRASAIRVILGWN